MVTISALSVNATFYEGKAIMCPKQDEIENTELKWLPSAKFERILEAASDGIVTLDKDGRYTYANTAAERILGVNRAQILRREFNETAWKLTTIK